MLALSFQPQCKCVCRQTPKKDKVWNDLPQEVVNAPDIISFKKLLDKA